MKEIYIHYKPLNFLPWNKSLKVMVPTQLSELTEKQFIAAAGFITGSLGKDDLLKIFLNINSMVVKKMDNSQRESILNLLNFLYNPEPVDSFLIDRVAMWYKAPLPHLKNITFKAFMAGDFYYQGYLSGFQFYLNWFIAYFYNKDSGSHETRVFTNAIIIGTENKKVLKAIAVNYGLIRLSLKNEYPRVFSMADEAEQINKSQSGLHQLLDFFVHYKMFEREKFINLPVQEALFQLETFIRVCHEAPDTIGLMKSVFSEHIYN